MPIVLYCYDKIPLVYCLIFVFVQDIVQLLKGLNCVGSARNYLWLRIFVFFSIFLLFSYWITVQLKISRCMYKGEKSSFEVIQGQVGSVAPPTWWVRKVRDNRFFRYFHHFDGQTSTQTIPENSETGMLANTGWNCEIIQVGEDFRRWWIKMIQWMIVPWLIEYFA